MKRIGQEIDFAIRLYIVGKEPRKFFVVVVDQYLSLNIFLILKLIKKKRNQILNKVKIGWKLRKIL